MRTSPYLRKMIGCKDGDYVIVYIFIPPITQEVKQKCQCHKPQFYDYGFTMSRIKPQMTDEEVNDHLIEYSDLGFDDLPAWLKSELHTRNLPMTRRQPTDSEKMITVWDAREHRIMNHELTIKDYIDKYMHARSLTLID